MVEYGRGCQLPLHSTVGRITACKPMPNGYFQVGYSAMFIAPRRVPLGARRVLYPSKQPSKNTE